MSQGGAADITASHPNIALVYDGNTGSAVPQSNTLKIVGTGDVSTSASGDTVTISVADSSFDFTGNTGTAAPSAGNINILGSGDVTTSCAGSTVTISANSSFNFTGNSGTAAPSAGNLNILGGGDVTTSCSGSTVTISATVTDSFVTDSGTAVPSSGSVSVVGTGNASTSASGNVITVNATGGDFPFGYRSGYYYFFSPLMTISSSTSAVSAGAMYVVPFYIGSAISIDRIAFEVSVASGANTNARLGLYNVSNGRFTTVNRTFGTQSTSSIAVQTMTVSESIPAGYYGMAIQFESTPTVYTNATSFVPAVPLLTPSTSFSRVAFWGYIFTTTYASGLPDLSAVNPDFNTNSTPTMQFRIA